MSQVGDIYIDSLSLSSIFLKMLFTEAKIETTLAMGTGFVWEKDGQHFLVTNWHNVTGRNPKTGLCLSKKGGVPNRIQGVFHTNWEANERTTMTFDLYDQDGRPLWQVHPQFGNKIDVVALPVEVPAAELHPINHVHTVPARTPVGTDVFVLGFPFGLGAAGFPIWKRASIASEPEATAAEHHYILVDTASREGMSGAPVIMRTLNAWTNETGATILGSGVATVFVGVYSGRLAVADALDAQLGIVWPKHYVEEVVAGGIRDTPWMES